MNFTWSTLIALLMTFCFWTYPPDYFSRSGIGHPGFSMTFDDNSIQEWYGLMPIFTEYQVKATFMVSLKYGITENELSMLRSLQDNGHEIGVHGYTHGNIVRSLKTQTISEYVNNEVLAEKRFLADNGIKAVSFAYVEGIRNQKLDHELLKYFTKLRAVSESQRHSSIRNIEKVRDIYEDDPSNQPVNALCIDSFQGISIDDIRYILHHLLSHPATVTFYAHKPVVEALGQAWEIEIDFLKEMFSVAKGLGLRSYLFSEIVS